jgi:Asp/Glu/hydantoin racemase
MVDIPVVGPGEAMRLLASTMGKRPAKITLELPVLEMRKDLKKTIELLKEAIKEKIREGYDSFYLGCLALWGLGKILREDAGVPVVDGAEASLKLAELLAELRLKPSRIAYPKYPPPHRTKSTPLI